MIVVGIDPHKKTHTAVAVSAATGEPLAQITVPARRAGHQRLLAWARRLSGERRFAIEDCRHVSGGLESLLVMSAERVVRVPPRMMGRARAGARTRGKSDSIDATAVARAALANPDLPMAAVCGPEREIAARIEQVAPQLLALVGCGPLTAAKLVGEIAGVARFHSPARLAMHAGVAPIPASSGDRQRHRLNRSGNRQLNCALHRVAVTQGRIHEPAREYLARKQAQGQSRMEALRCLKRHLANVVWRLLSSPATRIANPGAPSLAPGLT